MELTKRNPYTQYGFKNRKDYLLSLADEFCVSAEVVFSLAQILGPNEDFDGLINTLEDDCAMFVMD